MNIKPKTHFSQHAHYKGSIDSQLLVLTELFFNFVSFPLLIWGFIAYKNKSMSGLTLKISFDLY